MALRGGKASEDSFTILMANLVVAYAVDFQPVVFSSTALGLMACFEDPEFWPCPGLKTDLIRLEMV